MKMLSDLNRRPLARMRVLCRAASLERAGAKVRPAMAGFPPGFAAAKRAGARGVCLCCANDIDALDGIFMFSIAFFNKIALQTATDQGVQILATSQNVSATNLVPPLHGYPECDGP